MSYVHSDNQVKYFKLKRKFLVNIPYGFTDLYLISIDIGIDTEMKTVMSCTVRIDLWHMDVRCIFYWQVCWSTNSIFPFVWQVAFKIKFSRFEFLRHIYCTNGTIGDGLISFRTYNCTYILKNSKCIHELFCWICIYA